MNTALWIAQIILGLAFLGAGSMKLMKSRDELVEKDMGFVEDLTDTQVKTIGAIEVLGALGLILPAVTGILPVLTAIAAAGLVVTMLIAMAVHIKRSEYMPSLMVNSMLGGIALFIAIGRFGSQAL